MQDKFNNHFDIFLKILQTCIILSKILRNMAQLSEKFIWEVIIVTGLHYVNSWEQLS